jgi:hypothetical protein
LDSAISTERGISMLDEFDPQPRPEKAKTPSKIGGHEPAYWTNLASVDQILAYMVQYEHDAGFFNNILTGRYTQASVRSMQQLTEAINKASHSSTVIGWSLFAAATLTAILAAVSIFLR